MMDVKLDLNGHYCLATKEHFLVLRKRFAQLIWIDYSKAFYFIIRDNCIDSAFEEDISSIRDLTPMHLHNNEWVIGSLEHEEDIKITGGKLVSKIEFRVNKVPYVCYLRELNFLDNVAVVQELMEHQKDWISVNHSKSKPVEYTAMAEENRLGYTSFIDNAKEMEEQYEWALEKGIDELDHFVIAIQRELGVSIETKLRAALKRIEYLEAHQKENDELI